MPVSSRVAPRAGASRSQLLLVINGTLYHVHSLGGGATSVTHAFRLKKADGTIYDVAQTHFGPECDCPDFIFRRDGLDPAGCKHVRALIAQGLIRGEAEAPASRR